MLNIEKMTIKQVCNCLAMLNSLTKENFIEIDIDTAKIKVNYNKMANELYDIFLKDISNEKIEIIKNERDTYKRLAETYIKKYNSLKDNCKEVESIVQNDTTLNPPRQRNRIIVLLGGSRLV